MLCGAGVRGGVRSVSCGHSAAVVRIAAVGYYCLIARLIVSVPAVHPYVGRGGGATRRLQQTARKRN